MRTVSGFYSIKLTSQLFTVSREEVADSEEQSHCSELNLHQKRKVSMNRHSRSSAVSLSVLTAIGAACTTVGTWKVSRFVWRHYLRTVFWPRSPLSDRYGKATTAIVAGATFNLGRSCAVELARQGFHLVLIAHTAADLDELANSLRDEYKIQVMTISMDASSATPRDIETQLIQRLFQDETDVSILVNAAGVYSQRPCSVQDMAWQEADYILSVNCRFPIFLTSQLIPLLQRNAHQHGRAAILNWGSLTSCTPMALLSTYAATKAWTLHWSRCLAAELQPDHIDVLCTQPGLTTTTSTTTTLHKQQQQPGAGSMFANPDVVARNALNLLGVTRQKRVVPTPLHAFFVFLMEHVLPESWQDSLNRSAGLERLQRIHTAVPITEVSVPR